MKKAINHIATEWLFYVAIIIFSWVRHINLKHGGDAYSYFDGEAFTVQSVWFFVWSHLGLAVIGTWIATRFKHKLGWTFALLSVGKAFDQLSKVNDPSTFQKPEFYCILFAVGLFCCQTYNEND